MNPVRRLVKKLGLYKGKTKIVRINSQVAIIQPTKIALENNTIDQFNKEIVIHEGVEVVANEIRWGRVIKKYSYSEEKIKAIKQVHEIPIVERNFDTQMDFFQEPEFGSVENLI